MVHAELKVRRYGRSGRPVILVHGGPGAAGYLAPVAGELAPDYRVIEPFQRRSGGERLTVAGHVDDLRQAAETGFPGERPLLAGHSWGAMLVLAYAAAYPDAAGPLVLIGCGTFDPEARSRFQQTIAERMTPELRSRLAELDSSGLGPDERLARVGELLGEVYDYDPMEGRTPMETDARGHEETWADMMRLQAQGVYPSAFTRIRSRVRMIHGDHDPHPGRLIRDGLRPFIPGLEYVELSRCGHEPWRERHAAKRFFLELRRAVDEGAAPSSFLSRN